ncbi:carboxypeptidase regulatory-like domain-containing protein [Roseiconus lacunae]|uniref:Carboxypeptidase regulatory-like domain-containing protein n=1 Tax=Roseiconus lacunae TaxID=2605694 RepID=A0ABT7PNY7_9BACT|nr:carboxypeptidase regulatory-like domain-containing protein [Roseiconus lacunae]MDM4018222.1 carboxypeptidase regulatory-like domain-containing protein [Roseiconus lacunae]
MLRLIAFVGAISFLNFASFARAALPGRLEITVTDSAGQPIAGVRVRRSVWTDDKEFDRNSTFTTDDLGNTTVTLPKTMRILRLWVNHDDHPGLFANFDGANLANLSEQISVTMPESATIGGHVIDEAGKPIEGVAVEVDTDGDEQVPGQAPWRYLIGWDNNKDTVSTDAEGRWQLNRVPLGDDVEFRVQLRHDDYVSDSGWRESLQVKQGITTTQLRDQSASLTMARGLVLSGRIVNEGGDPVESARLTWTRDERDIENDSQMLTSGPEGQFRLPPMTAGPVYLAIAAKEYAPRRERIDLQETQPSIDFTLRTGRPLKVRVVDPDGDPITDAHVIVGSWGRFGSGIIGGGLNLLEDISFPKTDAQGISTWEHAPDESITLWASKKEWSRAKREVVATSKTYEITLAQPAVITGTVVDDQTDQPIEGVWMLPVDHYPSRPDDPIAQNGSLRVLSDGNFEIKEGDWDRDTELIVQFQAIGYGAVRIGPFGKQTGRITREVRLCKAPTLAGRVLDPYGQPAAGASVRFATRDSTVFAGDWTYRKVGSDRTTVHTDGDGRFELPATYQPPTIIVSHEAGFAEVSLDKEQPPGELRLKQWASVNGQLLREGQPMVGERISFRPIRMLGGDNPGIQDSFSTITEGEGRFSFDRVPPIPATLSAHTSVWRETTLSSVRYVPLDLEPGETRSVTLGDGVTVRGRVQPAGDIAGRLDLKYCLNYLLRQQPGISPPSSISESGFDATNGWSFNLLASQEGRGFLATLPYHFVTFQSDGSFEIHGVQPGPHQFAISIYEPPEGCLVDPVGRHVVDINVDKQAMATASMDVGLIEVDVSLGPQVGEPFPNFRYDSLIGQRPESISGLRGRHVLIDVWATWCAPCVAALPELRRAIDKLDDDRVAVLSLSLDEDISRAKRFVIERDMHWQQGFLASRDSEMVRQQLGISSVPVLFVLGPDGSLLHRCFKLDDALEFLDREMSKKTP